MLAFLMDLKSWRLKIKLQITSTVLVLTQLLVHLCTGRRLAGDLTSIGIFGKFFRLDDLRFLDLSKNLK
jgi:hypothetical protein